MMEVTEVGAHRLHRQLVSRQPLDTPAAVAAWFGAIQAQDYLGSLWALGLRTAAATEATVEAALAEGSVLRTHGFRGTWQYVARDDVRWMLQLAGERVIATQARRWRHLDLDARTLERSGQLIARALGGGKQLTRQELAAVLERRGIDVSVGRLMHILVYVELRGIICSGARRGKQNTYALLDERAPLTRTLTRDEALADLARRYFRSRGPATACDLSWWSGLPLGDVRAAIALAGKTLERVTIDDQEQWLVPDGVATRARTDVHLLPPFDECLIAYQDRREFLDARHTRRINNGGGILKPALLVVGRIAGTWRRTLGTRTLSVAVQPFRRLTSDEHAALTRAVDRYAAFLGREAQLQLLKRESK
jgi:hypothetical protein